MAGAHAGPSPGSSRSLAWRVDRSELGVRLSGHFRTPDAERIVAAVRQATNDQKTVEIDLGNVAQLDGSVAALLGCDLNERGVQSRLRGAERFRALFELCTEGAPPQRRVRRTERIVAHVGRVTVEGIVGLRRTLGFVGELALAVGRVIRRPRVGHWEEVPLLVERTGLDAVPVILVINFLVGFVMAFMAARSLALFGANLLVADLVAIAMTRQLGPMMTAIIVCGRSGAAFATELGSMKVSEEIDALRTLGIQPFEWLVIPRVVALVLVLPVLTLLADLVGMAGGLLVAVTDLGLSADSYVDETRLVLEPWDVVSGLVSSVSFAIAIGLISCQQGLAASGGPLGVGRRTTATVVTSLFAIVLLDAALTIAFRVLGR